MSAFDVHENFQIPLEDRPLEEMEIDAYVDWLSPYPWEYLLGPSFPVPVSAHEAERHLREWIVRLEKSNPHFIYFFVRGVGERAELQHLHGIVGCLQPITLGLLESTWKGQTRGWKDGRKVSGGLWIEEYDPDDGRGAIAYMVRGHEVRKGDLFLPPGKPNRRVHDHRRRQKRMEASTAAILEPVETKSGMSATDLC